MSSYGASIHLLPQARRPADDMKAIVGLLVAAVLVFGSGCATKQDWIDRTLVTVDVTGTWSGSVTGSGTIVMPGLAPVLLFELEQQGSTVKGYMRVGGSSGAASSWHRVNQGPVDGTVAGDVFRFRVTNGSLEGELKVSGDEMTGEVSLAGNRTLSLRRVVPSSPPGSPPR